MSNFSKKCLEVIKNIENNVQDKTTCAYIKEQIMDLLITYTDEMDSLKLNQACLENKINKAHNRISNIEDEIFIKDEDEIEEDDENFDGEYDFEITCPFCDYSFITDSSYENQTKINCPKCGKSIELDWGEEDNDSCNGKCGSCCGHCESNCDEEKSSLINEELEKYNKKNNNNEDDM